MGQDDETATSTAGANNAGLPAQSADADNASDISGLDVCCDTPFQASHYAKKSKVDSNWDKDSAVDGVSIR